VLTINGVTRNFCSLVINYARCHEGVLGSGGISM